MSLIIDLTPSEEERLSAIAKETGLDLAALVKKLVEERLPVVTAAEDDDLDARLRKWQQQQGTKLGPDISTGTLFAMWAKEDEQMTHEEREMEDRLWNELEGTISGAEGGAGVAGVYLPLGGDDAIFPFERVGVGDAALPVHDFNDL